MSKPPVIQTHHLIYANPDHKQAEVTARIYKGEHWLVTNLTRRKNISRGFIKTLKVWLALNEEKAKDL